MAESRASTPHAPRTKAASTMACVHPTPVRPSTSPAQTPASAPHASRSRRIRRCQGVAACRRRPLPGKSYLLPRRGYSQYAGSIACCLMTTPYAGQIGPTPRPARARVLRILLGGLVGSIFLACGLVVLAIIGSDTGVTGVLVGLALAAVPVFIVVPALLWLDRFEAEPTGLLL